MSEHFTKQAICDMAGIRHEYLNRIIDRYPDFPICYISKKSQVIPKFRFFPWYDNHKDNPMIKDKFDHDSIAVMKANYRPDKELQPIIKDYYRAQMQRERTELTINEYQALAMRTMNTNLSEKDILINGVMGLCGESGEAIEMVKKHIAQGHPLDKEALAKELGDIAWYLAETAYAIGYDLHTIFQMNIAKLTVRYPDGFDPNSSVNREGNE